MSDQEILNQLNAGDESCLQYLYEHLGMVQGWVMKNNGNQEDALDLFQEAIIVFYKKFRCGEFQVKGKLSTYLFEICKRQWYNQLNRRLKYEKANPHASQLDQRQESFSVEITNTRTSLKSYIKQALEKLGEPCKSLLEASIYLKMKMAEIAQEFNYADAHSARQQKLRCMKRLRSVVSYERVIQLD
ncbi:MAG: sigma-70 family RNA polymerase sigma factor [Cyclobacteriaceae bacterium]|nr:sigma-70 family RNA polymerase sigma factor [Cyclobacteriaceae bacterium]